MINTLIGSGEYFIWVLLMLSTFVYILSEVKNVRSSVNGVQMETMMSKVYVMFALQIAIGMAVVIFPFVKIFLGYAWFNTMSSTFFTMVILLLTMMVIRNVALQAKEVEGLRKDREQYKKDEYVGYTYYLISMWLLLLSAICGSLLLVRNRELIDTLMKDIGVVLIVVVYLGVFRLISRVIIGSIGKNEEILRNKKD